MPTELTVSLTRFGYIKCVIIHVFSSHLPNTHKFNINVDRKRFLEGRTLSPSHVIVLGVHLVRKRDLLMVAPR